MERWDEELPLLLMLLYVLAKFGDSLDIVSRIVPFLFECERMRFERVGQRGEVRTRDALSCQLKERACESLNEKDLSVCLGERIIGGINACW